jgi:ceramide glucosyltransferase
MDLLAVVRLRGHLRPALSDDELPETLPASSFFRPVNSGTVALRQKLEALIRVTRPQDQVLIAVDAGGPEVETAEALRTAYPERKIVVLPCPAVTGGNARVAHLQALEGAAEHPWWIVTDSDTMLDAAFVESFRTEWMERRSDALTAGYRHGRIRTWPQRMEAAAGLMTLWPGLLASGGGLAERTLPACTAVRAELLRAAGGWGRFQKDLEEGDSLAALIRAAGGTVHLSRHTVTVDALQGNWRTLWDRLHRSAAATLACNSAAGAVLPLLHGTPFALMLVAVAPSEAWRWLLLGGVWLMRWGAAWHNAVLLGTVYKHLGICSLFGPVIEFAAWCRAVFSKFKVF